MSIKTAKRISNKVKHHNRTIKGKGKHKTTGKGKGSIAGLSRVVVPKFLEMINTIKLYHWKTTSFSTHKATDQLLTDLNTKTDTFIEVMLGKSDVNRNKVLSFQTVKIGSFKTDAECKTLVNKYKHFLINLPNHPDFNTMTNVDLLNIRDEIVALLNQFLYLLTLK